MSSMELSLSLRKLIQSNVRLIASQQLFQHFFATSSSELILPTSQQNSSPLLRKIQVHFEERVDALVHMQYIAS